MHTSMNLYYKLLSAKEKKMMKDVIFLNDFFSSPKISFKRKSNHKCLTQNLKINKFIRY